MQVQTNTVITYVKPMGTDLSSHESLVASPLDKVVQEIKATALHPHTKKFFPQLSSSPLVALDLLLCVLQPFVQLMCYIALFQTLTYYRFNFYIVCLMQFLYSCIINV